MPAWKVVPAAENVYAAASDDFATGLSVANLIGRDDGAVHLEVSLTRLDPGGSVVSHVHPFEESFYVLEGTGVFTVADQAYRVREGSFGFAPIRTARCSRLSACSSSKASKSGWAKSKPRPTI